MVSPITGPFHLLQSSSFPEGGYNYFDDKTWYRQKKPFNLKLAYQRYRASYGRSGYPMVTDASGIAQAARNPDGQALAEAASKAWSKFVDDISVQAEIGNSLAEGKQALGMVSSRLLQVAKFAKHLNRFEFEKARKALDLSRKQTKDIWSRDRTSANLFLECHFGWSPLVSDIYSGMEVLTSEFKPHVATGRGTGSVTRKYSEPPPMWGYGSTWNYTCRRKYSAEVSVSNPNVALANQLGLLNPIATLWELVPYSFVVDWFTNVGQILSSWSDLFGYNIVNPSTTTLTTVSMTGHYAWNYPRNESGTGMSIDRTLSLIKPTPYIRPFRGLSAMRGITAAALLMQKMPNRKADLATPSLREKRVYRWNDFKHP